MNRGGRPKLPIDAATVAELREAGHSWRSIARQIGAGYGTVRRAYQRRAKTVPKPILAALLLALGLLPRAGVTVTICTSKSAVAYFVALRPQLELTETP